MIYHAIMTTTKIMWKKEVKIKLTIITIVFQKFEYYIRYSILFYFYKSFYLNYVCAMQSMDA